MHLRRTIISPKYRATQENCAQKPEIYTTMNRLEAMLAINLGNTVAACADQTERNRALAMVERRLLNALETARAELLSQPQAQPKARTKVKAKVKAKAKAKAEAVDPMEAMRLALVALANAALPPRRPR